MWDRFNAPVVGTETGSVYLFIVARKGPLEIGERAEGFRRDQICPKNVTWFGMIFSGCGKKIETNSLLKIIRVMLPSI